MIMLWELIKAWFYGLWLIVISHLFLFIMWSLFLSGFTHNNWVTTLITIIMFFTVPILNGMKLEGEEE